jgi:mono/diheme cytochrome c family protein
MYFVQAGLPAEQFGGLLTQQVRNGKPGSVMPKFSPDELSQGELDSIGLYLAVEGAALGGLDHANPPPPLTGSAEAGAVQYGRHCVVCHGPDAMGSEIVPPIALDAAGMKQGGLPPSALHGLLLLACRSGELEQMPIYSVKDLSDQQLADIAAWLWESAPEMP